MAAGTRSNSDKRDECDYVVAFLKSDEFSDIIKKIVSKETKLLQKQIADLKTDIQILRQSNIELVKVLTDKSYIQSKSSTVNNDETTVFPITSVSYADKTNSGKTSSGQTQQKRITQKIISGEEILVHKNKKNVAENINIETSSLERNIGLSQNEDWVNVKRKKSYRNNKRSITGSCDSIELKAVPKKSFLFVSRIRPNTDKSALKAHLVQYFPEAEVEDLTSSYPEVYKSFKVIVNQTSFEDALDSSKWPSGAYVTKFFRKYKST